VTFKNHWNDMCLGCMPNDHNAVMWPRRSRLSHLPRASDSFKHVWNNQRQNDCLLQQFLGILQVSNVVPATKTICRHFCSVLQKLPLSSADEHGLQSFEMRMQKRTEQISRKGGKKSLRRTGARSRRQARRYIFYAGGSLAGAGYCRQCRQRPAILLLQ